VIGEPPSSGKFKKITAMSGSTVNKNSAKEKQNADLANPQWDISER
jgi:hypothetical protein